MTDPTALTCRPMIALKRIARLVRSSSRMARASAAWSSNETRTSRWERSRLAKKLTERSAGNSWDASSRVASGLPHLTQGPGNNIRTVSAAPGSPTLIIFA
jgi:hypothetical protein